MENIPDILFAMQKKFQAVTSHLDMEFPYFLTKRAPVTGKESLMDYSARFEAAACHHEIDFVLTVIAKVTTLCPCSKAISARGAHNQRGGVTVRVRFRKPVWIEDLIAFSNLPSAIVSPKARSIWFASIIAEGEARVSTRGEGDFDVDAPLSGEIRSRQ